MLFIVKCYQKHEFLSIKHYNQDGFNTIINEWNNHFYSAPPERQSATRKCCFEEHSSVMDCQRTQQNL